MQTNFVMNWLYYASGRSPSAQFTLFDEQLYYVVLLDVLVGYNYMPLGVNMYRFLQEIRNLQNIQAPMGFK